MTRYIDIFSALGSRLSSFGGDDNTLDIIERAIAENPWFTREEIVQAIEAICQEMLDRAKLTQWIARYPAPAPTPKRVAVIMAGNIPLVGFFDLLCVLMSGHECHIKPSSKDRVLMTYIVDQLKAIDDRVPIFEYSTEQEYDMVIATGGDDANRYFREHFATTRRLLRGSRHSVAVLTSDESDDELHALTRDITSYSGLGCRSVSMIFTPQAHRPKLPKVESSNTKLMRNTAATRAMLTMQRTAFVECGAFLVIEGEEFPKSLSVVTLRPYSDINEVNRWLENNRDKIQCVVSHHPAIENAVPFGRAQYPTLYDYADGVDTMQFLLN